MLGIAVCLKVQMNFWPIRTIVDSRPALHTRGYSSTGNFMCRALITIVFGAAMVGASLNALGHKIEPSLPVNSTVLREAAVVADCIPAGPVCKSTTLLKPARAPISGQMDSVSYRNSDRFSSVPVQNPVTIQPTGTSFSWRSVAALLSTLALIGMIVLRRSGSGKT